MIYSTYILQVMCIATLFMARSNCQPGKCDQTPPQTKVAEPSENKELFKMTIDTKDINLKDKFLPDQTYVLTLVAMNSSRPFRTFMITAENPEVDENENEFDHGSVDVGSLKTLDTDRLSRYSERCYSSVENTDTSDKYKVEIHWVSPKQTDKISKQIRFRATVSENEEVWYTGEYLTVILQQNADKPIDSPPQPPRSKCHLCSEARYEVIFHGKWSRMTHPRHYPSRPDDNGYSYMIGCSHNYDYVLWQQGAEAKPGLKLLAEEGNITEIQREIISEMGINTRTLIKGKRRHHPHMAEPSHSLFRVDRDYHLFSLVVAMRPSPDWFLGTTRFELCTDNGWMEEFEMPLYPWDAGTMDGVSYESPRTVTQPMHNVERVAVGSFDRDSPFYQMNLNDLKPFAKLHVRRLDVYPLEGVECNEQSGQETDDEPQGVVPLPRSEDEEPDDSPKIAEWKPKENTEDVQCNLSAWSEWSPCVPEVGSCGRGSQTRRQYRDDKNIYYESYTDPERLQVYPIQNEMKNCEDRMDLDMVQYQDCFVYC